MAPRHLVQRLIHLVRTLESRHWQAMKEWAVLWNVPGLESRVDVRFDGRLRSSLGRCHPAKGSIALQPTLLEGQPALLAEVLCHEFAHVAVWTLHGGTAKPHGPEWTELVEKAGFAPRTALPATKKGEPLRRLSGLLYEHSCPVCHFSRVARRPVPTWRCPDCREAGLPGEMLILSAGRARA